ncbi:uncharacterized protein Z519_07646 [Cladophialophora bantiana CBS 173.52]|uniref:Uncharacterized protein n=1 Tax=Cladophialophora bantiana (strain ATCC 10958 / CBS 173.52 / CDC B-1940 / NIH 8579) TaxID=1442370 RepID=A0A0D2HEG0_CLAB1|nr:uncharacterized protein Z519_07646 [Cladophialophora bantiana CBS 173.52]KIW91678.1 hypothetical protein Z519_07646 [Cladophialophora bantiana CBS 173.52]
MPLFGHKNNAHEPTPAQTTAPRYSNSADGSPRRGFFSRHRSSSASSADLDSHNRRHGSNKLSHGSTRSSGGLFHRNHEDPSIIAAREQVLSAENAEREADRALVQARAAVREAKDRVKMLEREAEEEARLAKIKQHQAKDISKRAKPLGRECYYAPGLASAQTLTFSAFQVMTTIELQVSHTTSLSKHQLFRDCAS